jgi:excisionase family DNA binding protein
MARPREVPDAPAVPLEQRTGMITAEELAGYMGVPVQTTDYWASKGGGPVFHKVGRNRRYWPAEVMAWIGPGQSTTGDAQPAEPAA